MQQAQATGDIAALLHIVTSTSAMTTSDFIQKTCGSILFLYYSFVDRLRVRPTSLDDLVDGLLYLDAKQYIIKQGLNKSNK